MLVTLTGSTALGHLPLLEYTYTSSQTDEHGQTVTQQCGGDDLINEIADLTSYVLQQELAKAGNNASDMVELLIVSDPSSSELTLTLRAPARLAWASSAIQ